MNCDLITFSVSVSFPTRAVCLPVSFGMAANVGCCCLTHTIHPNTVVDQGYPLIPTTLPNGSGPPAGQCGPGTQQTAQGTQWMAQGVYRASKFPRSQSDRASVRHAGAGLVHGGPTLQHTRLKGSTIKCPGARHHRTPSEVLSPCLDRSELFWLHKGNLHNIRQVVRMFCLIAISVYALSVSPTLTWTLFILKYIY